MGRFFWPHAFLYRDWYGDRTVDRRQYCDRDRGRMLPSVRISFILQMKWMNNIICEKKKVCRKIPAYLFFLRSFHFTGSQAGSTYVHLFCSAVRCLYFYGFYIGFPHFI